MLVTNQCGYLVFGAGGFTTSGTSTHLCAACANAAREVAGASPQLLPIFSPGLTPRGA